jgi:nucleoid-associated protein YgaU
MALEKLTIKPEEGQPITVRFNPERYTLNKGVQIAEIAIPGLDSPVLQFVRGQNEKITLELFFDTTKHGMVDNVKDVREETKKIYHLLKIIKKTHAPPRCTLLWGEGGQLFSFGSFPKPRCVLESVSEEFNLFSPSGVPLRAKLNVTFREYKSIEDQIKEINKESSDRTKIFEVERGQTLSQIAWLEYQDPDEWRRIAEANNLENPRFLAPGTKLRIPRISPEAA